MQAKGDTAIDMEMMIESTEHLNNLKSDSPKGQITDQSGENQSLNQKVSQIDLEFQKLLCQLIETKLSENTITQVRDLLRRLSGSLIMGIPNGPQILNSLYQIILKFPIQSIIQCIVQTQKVDQKSEIADPKEAEFVPKVKGYPNKPAVRISFVQIAKQENR
ncbi:unnamed protein product (macronuclear) [Paramecium tetraurelia]|uniref:Uncharacterized protein n=1 Tax=Paramecium tetraurelia TaxID=5888 RepID=A0D5B7_PARTE|nr:uncharacterized protein GSPATT00013682001 [Paramecium tetraurelia]CAK78234.1 unnamed protein product [Paramecium tetraurelia]|eukprot:XP_001445631.1 hypothetical protein (macronuclear) [Paramecium tetraurelia strain d4-2]